MELINQNNLYNHFTDDMVITIGAFDGIHIGHQRIFSKMRELAENAKTLVITFSPHPDYVLKKRDNTGYISIDEEKIKLLEYYQIDYLMVLNFDDELSNMQPNDFIANYISPFKVKKVVVGHDFRFGKEGSGTVDTLKQFYDVLVVDDVTYNQDKLGSMTIRQLLSSGDISSVNKALNRKYSISGTVVGGSKIGRTIGFPTANLKLSDNFTKLKIGVYAVEVLFADKKYYGVCNIGNNPSINYIDKPRIEVHIIDFNQDIYGKTITIYFNEYIREEKKFSSTAELKTQIANDVEYVRSKI